MTIWHDEDCQGYECACTQTPFPGAWFTNSKGNKVTFKETPPLMTEEELTSRRAQEEREREQRRLNRARIDEQYGIDDFADGTMIRFYKMYQKDGTLYTFGAIKSDHYWYITSVEGKQTWYDFIEFFEKENLLDGVFFFAATDYESVYEVDTEDDE